MFVTHDKVAGPFQVVGHVYRQVDFGCDLAFPAAEE